MTSITHRIPVLILCETNTQFTAVRKRDRDDYHDLGVWILDEARTIAKYCAVRGIHPAIQLIPTIVDQMDLDALEAEELIYHTTDRPSD